ncbi:MAG: single-stranded-DNA-specific exonuclease RecJ [Paludibacteraceae bacterium]|nr:single-stranded-DNA-specific exonuclease RecJ [Paludibacteraceae bacterium]MBQ6963199.1 single-stranded-DNA-specific exonuclease RecJ [Paludibacteraceae bacterium]MCM8872017.1 single-stranded-DNA-specific exonuclease RecJ [Paludibacteraceae bacterium]
MVKWNFNPLTNEQEQQKEQIAKDLGINPVLAQLLVQRGVATPEEARHFFHPRLSDLHDPFLMKDMDKAVDRLNEALQSRERILIYGDYDVDGTTAVSLVYKFIGQFHSDLLFYLPDRDNEGSGISYKGIDYAVENGCSLIIALDCGIKAIEKVDYAKEHGVDFIICDHHTTDDRIPDAVAVLDPKRNDCDYPYKHLCGCGVGFKFMQAFAMSNGLGQSSLFAMLDFVAVSIASDIVPITGENRVMAYYGLKQLNTNPSLGLKNVIKIAGLAGKDIQISDIVFKIGPRINASGRIQQARDAVELLVAKDKNFAWQRCLEIDHQNDVRKDLDKTITEEALEKLKADATVESKSSVVVYDPDWHKGVIAIVASRLSEKYYRPAVVLTKSNGMVTGSARSIPGFDIYSAIESCRDLLENFGGHMYAVGLAMKEENLPAFEARFEQFVAENIQPDQRSPQVDIDAMLDFKDITPRFYKTLRQFNPFGPENNKPIFCTKGVFDSGYSKLVGKNNEHLKLDVRDGSSDTIINGIAFRQCAFYEPLRQNKPLAICYTLEDNKFNALQLMVRDIKLNEDAF